jgi:hypothetical protein
MKSRFQSAMPRCVTKDQMSAIREPLVGQRVVLRELLSTDWEGIHSYASLAEACRYQSWGPNTQEQSRAFCYQQIAAVDEEPRKLYALAITTPGNDSIIGMASLHVHSFEHGQDDISYIVHPRDWAAATRPKLPFYCSSSDSQNSFCIAFTRRAIRGTSPQRESWKRSG